MTTLVQHRHSVAIAKAVAFYRRNPQATLKEVALACDISERTASTARQQMVREGVCKPSRKVGGRAPAGELEPPIPPEPEPAPAPSQPVSNALIDGEQLALLATGDTSDVEDADPETRKRMLRELRAIAFNKNNHPDTQVTAMKAWFALKDAAAAKDMGPGKPKTREDAITRLRNLDTAVGLTLALDALIAAYTIADVLLALEAIIKGVADDAQAVDEADSPSSPVQAVGETINNA